MNTLISEPLAKSVSFDENNLLVDLRDGRTLSVPLAFFPRLLHATPSGRKKFVISGGGIGIHWDELDEDISVKYLLMGVGDRTGESSHQPEPAM